MQEQVTHLVALDDTWEETQFPFSIKLLPSLSFSPSCGRRCVSGGALLSAGQTQAPPLRQSLTRPSCAPPVAPPPAAWFLRWSSPRGTYDMSSSPRQQQPIIAQSNRKTAVRCSRGRLSFFFYPPKVISAALIWFLVFGQGAFKASALTWRKTW